VRKGQYALKHNKDQDEYEYDKSYKECTRKPKINQFNDPSECVWRYESDNVNIKGIDKHLRKTAEGRKQNETLNAAKNHRFGIVHQTKKGEKVIKRYDEGLTTVSQSGVTSKFKSCFGDLAPVNNKKQFVSTGNRKKPVSYFDTLKRNSEAMNRTNKSDLSQLHLQ
jgi:hypothetical protein